MRIRVLLSNNSAIEYLRQLTPQDRAGYVKYLLGEILNNGDFVATSYMFRQPTLQQNRLVFSVFISEPTLLAEIEKLGPPRQRVAIINAILRVEVAARIPGHAKSLSEREPASSDPSNKPKNKLLVTPVNIFLPTPNESPIPQGQNLANHICKNW